MIEERGAVLYRRYLDGDESAFDEILLTYREGLTYFIYRFVNNVDVAEDIAADVFAYLIFKPKKYNFKVSLKTYLYMIGRSRALDWLRKESKRRHLPIESLYNEPSADASILEETVINNDKKKRLHAAIKQLPENYRTATLLVYFENLSYKEAALIMGKNEKQIENLLYRAKHALKRILEENGYEE